jgi:DNA-binding transcriptional regulator YiaG
MPTSPKPEDVRAARKRLGMSQAALGAALGASTRTVEDWEGARRTPPAMLELALKWLLAERV